MSKNPYWEYAGTRYTSKFDALVSCKRDFAGISFHQFDPEFYSYDWSQEPIESLNELILQRCLQLRDSYSHLKLWYSGGADSTTVLNAFLKHNIYIDEIIMERWSYRNDQNNFGNTEINDFAIPFIKKIHNLIPKTKINILDYNYKHYENLLKKDNWFYKLNNFELRHMHAPNIQGKNFCNIFCNYEPALKFIKGRWYDIQWDTSNYQDVVKYRNVEQFFTTTSLPKLHAKQCYILKRYLEKNPLSDPKKYKEVVTKVLRDKAVAPRSPYFKIDKEPYQGFKLREKDKFFLKDADPKFIDYYKNIITTKINGMPFWRAWKGVQIHKIELGT